MNNDEDVRQLIADLRGGFPDACSFCGNPTLETDLHPEEGGDWACTNCLKRWGEWK